MCQWWPNWVSEMRTERVSIVQLNHNFSYSLRSGVRDWFRFFTECGYIFFIQTIFFPVELLCFSPIPSPHPSSLSVYFAKLWNCWKNENAWLRLLLRKRKSKLRFKIEGLTFIFSLLSYSRKTIFRNTV